MTQKIVELLAHLSIHPGISDEKYGESSQDAAVRQAMYSSYLGGWIEKMERLFLIELGGIEFTSATFSVEEKVPTISTTVKMSAKRCPDLMDATERWIQSWPDSEDPSTEELTQEQLNLAERPILREMERILGHEFTRHGFLLNVRAFDLQPRTTAMVAATVR